MGGLEGITSIITNFSSMFSSFFEIITDNPFLLAIAIAAVCVPILAAMLSVVRR